MSLGSWLKAKAQQIGAWFKAEVKAIAPVVLADLEAAAKALEPIAAQLVIGLISAELSGDDKRHAATTALLKAAEDKAIPISKIYIDKLIQDAVFALAIHQDVQLVAPAGSPPDVAALVQAAELLPVSEAHSASLAQAVAAETGNS